MDSNLLFQRLIRIGEHSPESLEDIFAFELCSVPAALFDTSCLPRHPNKSTLANHIWNEVKLTSAEIPAVPLAYVFDGGSLLHHVPWSKGQKYSQVAQSYVQYIVRRTKGHECTVVFDGYRELMSTKDAAHLRRSRQCVSSPDITFDEDMQVTESRERFLSNQNNKQRFIDYLNDLLMQNGILTEKASGDADRLIVKVALERARHCHTVVLGEDTDLLMLLLFHLTSQHWPVFFGSSRSGPNQARIWDIEKVQHELGSNICQQLLVLHAISGCDTTSALYGLGKAIFLRKAKKSASFSTQVKKFLLPDMERGAIEQAGERVLVEVYGGRQQDTINKLRYIKYNQKLSSCSTALQPCNLPPTRAAANFHAQRTYYQVQEWIDLDTDKIDLDPLKWGWEDSAGLLLPVLTDIDVGPDHLLKGVKCECKTDCSMISRCSCKRYGILCTPACPECRGETCKNRGQQPTADIE